MLEVTWGSWAGHGRGTNGRRPGNSCICPSTRKLLCSKARPEPTGLSGRLCLYGMKTFASDASALLMEIGVAQRGQC